MSGMRRRGVLGMLAGGAAMAGLAACGGGNSGGQGSGKGTVVFRLWDETQQVGYQKSAEAFHKKNPDITIKIEQLDYADYWSKLTTEFAAGKGPDIFWNTVPYFPELVSQGVLVDLESLISKDNFDFSGFYDQVTQSYVYKGHRYGMPVDFGITGMVYNSDLFKAAGVAAPDQLTWAPDGTGTLVSTARRLTKGKQYGFMAENHNQTQYINWIPQNGGTFMSKPFGTFTFNGAKATEALQWQVDLIKKYKVAPAPSVGAALDLFNRGQVAMYPCVNAILPFIVPKVNFKVGVAPLPTGPQGAANNVNGLSVALNAHSTNQKAAWEVMKWFGSAESQRIMGTGGYVWPALKDLSDTYTGYWKAKGQDLTPFLDAAKGTTETLPITPVWNAAELKIDNAFLPMFNGQQPVKSTADTLVKQLNQLIKDQG